ncbi:hypothetical protein F4814DRAFT_420361 [Daldinia grandis]|nr:hypothetical protein F4814DRAFT_420361 [Daldinia grandis]
MAKKTTLPRTLRCVKAHTEIAIAEVNKRLKHLRDTHSSDHKQVLRLYTIITFLEIAMEKDIDQNNVNRGGNEAAATATTTATETATATATTTTTTPVENTQAQSDEDEDEDEDEVEEHFDPRRHPVLAERQRRQSCSRLDIKL